MRRKLVVLAGVLAALSTTISTLAQQSMPPENAPTPEMPKQATRTGKRVNRIVDMWLKGQPVYYSQISGGGYDQGKAMAATKTDNTRRFMTSFPRAGGRQFRAPPAPNAMSALIRGQMNLQRAPACNLHTGLSRTLE